MRRIELQNFLNAPRIIWPTSVVYLTKNATVKELLHSVRICQSYWENENDTAVYKSSYSLLSVIEKTDWDVNVMTVHCL